MLKRQTESFACLAPYGLWMLNNAFSILHVAGRCGTWIFLPLRDIRLLFYTLLICGYAMVLCSLLYVLCCGPFFFLFRLLL
jgi:hypothetical protein